MLTRIALCECKNALLRGGTDGLAAPMNIGSKLKEIVQELINVVLVQAARANIIIPTIIKC